MKQVTTVTPTTAGYSDFPEMLAKHHVPNFPVPRKWQQFSVAHTVADSQGRYHIHITSSLFENVCWKPLAREKPNKNYSVKVPLAWIEYSGMKYSQNSLDSHKEGIL